MSSSELQPLVAVVTGELVDPTALAARAAEVAARQRSPQTRRTYAAVYRTFAAFLGPDATPEDFTAEAVRAYRDALERTARSPATVAKHLSALRGLAEALGIDAQLRTLSHDEWSRLLRMPDRRTRHGKRDLALLHLLGSAGLRRAEAAGLLVADVDERRRSSDPRLRQAIKGYSQDTAERGNSRAPSHRSPPLEGNRRPNRPSGRAHGPWVRHPDHPRQLRMTATSGSRRS